MHRREIRCIGVDPGLVNHAICRIAFRGFEYRRAAQDGAPAGALTKVPLFDILDWELWNLKRKITYRNDGTGRVRTNKYENTGTVSEELLPMGAHMNQFVRDAAWLFEKDEHTQQLVPLISELQCGHVKRGNTAEVYAIAHLLPCAIRANDLCNQDGHTRRIVSGARKYGIRRDEKAGRTPQEEALIYQRHKQKSEEVGKALLTLLGHKQWLTFLNLIEMAQKRDSPNKKKAPQVHDLTDALLLALHWAVQEWEAAERALDTARTAPPPPVQICIFDDEEDDLLEERIKRKRKAPAPKSKKAPAKKAKCTSL